MAWPFGLAVKKFVEAHLQTLTIQFTELEQTGILNEDIIKNFFLLYLNVSPGDGVVCATTGCTNIKVFDFLFILNLLQKFFVIMKPTVF